MCLECLLFHIWVLQVAPPDYVPVSCGGADIDQSRAAPRLCGALTAPPVPQSAARLMRHSGRRRLTHGDMSRALRWYGAPPVLGHSTRRPLTLVPLTEGGFWVPEQRDCDLAQLALSPDPPPPQPPVEPPLSGT